MNEERPSENTTEGRQVERDSQLSAMFDGELSAAECELLARRLSRDEALRAQWSRYSMIGAALRAERGVKLNDNVARRVQAAVAQETTYGDSSTPDSASNSTRSRIPANASAAATSASERWMRYARPVMGASVAAGVAAVSILWLRTQGTEPELVADATPATESIVLQPEPQTPLASTTNSTTLVAAAQVDPAPASNGEPQSLYTTPPTSSQTSIAPPARFANYVVAHSEYSGPLARRMALMGILGTEAGADDGENAAAARPADGTANPETR